MQTAAANLAKIMIRPRPTMRRILDAGRDRMILPLVALAAVSGFLGDFNIHSIEALPVRGVPLPLLIAGLVLGSILVTLLLFYLASWAVFGVGRLLEGTGSAREVRSAVAWGLVPIIWALLYRLPAVFLVPRPNPTEVGLGGGSRFRFDPGRFGSSCVTALIFGALELTVVIWCVTLVSNTIGEAHRFSSWRGLATIALVGISPAIIAIAALLAM